MKNKIYISILAIALIFTGCSKDFLETEVTQFASADQIREATVDNPGLQNANIAGLYSTLITAGSGGTNLQHTDYGQKAYDVFGDMLSGDVVLAGYNYGWYQDIVEYQSTVDFTSINNYMPWRFYYRLVFGANIVIDGLGGNDAVLEDDTAKHIMGQAKAIRGFAYFYLVNYFAKGDDLSALAVPIYTDISQEAQPLSSAQDVYNQAASDLTEAIELLATFNRTAKNEINGDVAKALLAYTYAGMGDYTKAQQLTQEIINSGAFPIMGANQIVASIDPATISETNPFGTSATGGFNDVNNTSWMWGQDITLDNGLDLVSWWGQMDIFTYSYAYVGDAKSINVDLYNKIPADDVRKGQFVEAYAADQYLAINKFFTPERIEGGQRLVTTDYIYMRVAEMYLLNAEAAARNGDETAAKTSLKALLSERMPDVTYIDALSGQALLDEIYLQTRIELWGEGKSYLAMKRNKATVNLGSNHLTFPDKQIPYNADEMTFEIPDAERLNNPNINL